MNKNLRPALIAGNWKMNKLSSEVPAFVSELMNTAALDEKVEAALCVPFPLLGAMLSSTKETPIFVGAQDVSTHDAGAYTGEVSAPMLADLGLRFCIVGHSERRQYFGETDFQVNEKIRKLLDAGLTPIVCVGESREQRELGITEDFIACQIKSALYGFSAEEVAGLVIAYEPIWAIGTGLTATAEQAEEICGRIREIVGELFGKEVSDRLRVLYGGSMNPKNAEQLLAKPDIDGGLIGGASLRPAEFAALLEAASHG